MSPLSPLSPLHHLQRQMWESQIEQKELQPWWEGEDHLRAAKNFVLFLVDFGSKVDEMPAIDALFLLGDDGFLWIAHSN